jgi:hypothetical protein
MEKQWKTDGKLEMQKEKLKIGQVKSCDLTHRYVVKIRDF